jgi:DNA-binding MarR family transcriptional regulator
MLLHGIILRAAQDGTELAPDTLQTLEAAAQVLAGVALQSVDALDRAVTLPQFRMLAVLADLGRARSVQVAWVLGLETSTVTGLADQMVAAGYVSRGGEPGHRGGVILELTVAGRDLVGQVAAWLKQELARILRQLLPAGRARSAACYASSWRPRATATGPLPAAWYRCDRIRLPRRPPWRGRDLTRPRRRGKRARRLAQIGR